SAIHSRGTLSILLPVSTHVTNPSTAYTYRDTQTISELMWNSAPRSPAQKAVASLNLHLPHLGINLRFFYFKHKYLVTCYRYRVKSFYCNDLHNLLPCCHTR